jgi:hypothetical protein
MAAMTTQMAWGAIAFKDGYSAAGESDNLKAALKWATDYMVECHTSKFEFIGQVGSLFFLSDICDIDW